jgi:hypothetical protein
MKVSQSRIDGHVQGGRRVGALISGGAVDKLQ